MKSSALRTLRLGSRVTLPRPLPNPVKVSSGERCGRLIRRLQEPGFKLRCDLKRPALLVAHATEHVIRQFAGVAGNARPNLLLQEFLNVFGQSNGHEERIPLGSSGEKLKAHSQRPRQPSLRPPPQLRLPWRRQIIPPGCPFRPSPLDSEDLACAPPTLPRLPDPVCSLSPSLRTRR